MANQAAKVKRTKVAPKPPEDVVSEIAESLVDDLLGEAKRPQLEDLEFQRQRAKLQVMGELQEFRASFSRGYAVILTELARKRVAKGNQQKE